MTEKIGVFICGCGPNIKSVIDVETLLDWAGNLENVACAKTFDLLCADDGQVFLENEIRESALTRVVVAGCTPKEHETTFRRVMKNAGLNPYLLQIANVREQCAWVTPDGVLATEKAKRIIEAAVQRVLLHEPLVEKRIACNPDVLVLGAGVAGLSAAATLAQQGRTVYLVERDPCIGGKAIRFETLFPDETCAACVLEPMVDEVLNHPGIRLITLAELSDLKGYFGNFEVTLHRKPRYVDSRKCLGCGECMAVCPVSVVNEFNEGLDSRKAITIPYPGAMPNVARIDEAQCLHFTDGSCVACRDGCPFDAVAFEDTEMWEVISVGALVLATGFDLFDLEKAPEYGYGKIPEIYNSLEFERIANSDGPTGGKILLKEGRPPRRIALVHCAGSRSPLYNEYCSGICCTYTLKFARMIRQKAPDTTIFQLYADWCFPMKEAQPVFNSARAENTIRLHRMASPGSLEMTPFEGGIRIVYTDVSGADVHLGVDMVILSPSMEGSSGSLELAERTGVGRDVWGFFSSADPILSPVSTAVDGIYIAGCAQSPKDVAGAVAQGQAAAGNILKRLIPGEKITIEPMTAEVDESRCAGCRICIGTCGYGALCHDEDRHVAVINDLICRGCGFCAAACPAEAIGPKHFKSRAILSEISGLLKCRKNNAL